jgi:2-polyprenyl-3-methyl-5-hydroxy-6-metoxy-1,4-benzoquinol methylase
VHRQTVDEKLNAWYREAHDTGTNFRGLSVMHHDRDIRRLIVRACGPKSEALRVLDYGCGAGMQYEAPHNLQRKLHIPKPTLYDPGNAMYAEKPAGTFDGVICSDVLEHVPEALVGNVLAEVFDYAERFVWMSVCCRAAKKVFPDGTNMHVTVKGEQWWRKQVAKHAKAGVVYDLIFTP